MKRILLQVSASIHLTLFFGWLLPMMGAFIGRTAKVSTWAAILGLFSIIGQIAWAILEDKWTYEIRKKKR